MTNPKFSVITVSFNHGNFIRQTIESVLWQKHPSFEHIVIDGGSTDQTVSILKQYPHLKWVSEPDRGQSHALNKGLAQAKGEIIAWINSDDWYPPGTFTVVEEALKEYPIVMGACELTDKYGIRKEVVPNVERNWFDMLKYWVYFSSPAQPSIFFKREILEDVRYPNGDVIDEGLDFAMDLDLWLRLSKKYPLQRKIPRVMSYYRTYDTNKTGGSMSSVYREMSRVFRRYSAGLGSEQNFSFVVPVEDPKDIRMNLISQIASQALPNSEIVFVDRSSEPAVSRRIRDAVLELENVNKRLTFRRLMSPDRSLTGAISCGLAAASAPLVTYLAHNESILPDFSLTVGQIFQQDNLALLMPNDSHGLQQTLYRQTPEGPRLQFDQLFTLPTSLTSFVIRKAAFVEQEPLLRSSSALNSYLLFFKQLLLSAVHRGWTILVGNIIADKTQSDDEWAKTTAEVFRSYVASHMIIALTNDLLGDAFAQLRAQHGFAIVSPAQLLEQAYKTSSTAPPNWFLLDQSTPQDILNSMISQYPQFSPAYFMLSRILDKNGAGDEARQLMNRWQSLKQSELW